jgi:hypothetical protein
LGKYLEQSLISVSFGYDALSSSAPSFFPW